MRIEALFPGLAGRHAGMGVPEQTTLGEGNTGMEPTELGLATKRLGTTG